MIPAILLWLRLLLRLGLLLGVRLLGLLLGVRLLGLSLNCFERAGAGDLDLDGDLETGRPFDPERD